MRRQTRRAIGLGCGAIFAVLSPGAIAADDNRRWASLGWGSKSCGAFVQAEMHSPTELAGSFIDWAQGFLSEYNRTHDDVYNIVGGRDPAAIEQWLRNYCAARPLAH